jgi:hypothetical protein
MRCGGQGGRPLSPRTTGHAHRLLRTALAHASRWRLSRGTSPQLCGRPRLNRERSRYSIISR